MVRVRRTEKQGQCWRVYANPQNGVDEGKAKAAGLKAGRDK
jgi:hypothetical protein